MSSDWVGQVLWVNESNFPAREISRKVLRRRDRWEGNEDFQPIVNRAAFRPRVEKWRPILPPVRSGGPNRSHPSTGHACAASGWVMNLWKAKASRDATGPAFRTSKPMDPSSPDFAAHFLHLVHHNNKKFRKYAQTFMQNFFYLGRQGDEGQIPKIGSQLHLHSSLNTVQVRCSQRRRYRTGAASPEHERNGIPLVLIG